MFHNLIFVDVIREFLFGKHLYILSYHPEAFQIKHNGRVFKIIPAPMVALIATAVCTLPFFGGLITHLP